MHVGVGQARASMTGLLPELRCWGFTIGSTCWGIQVKPSACSRLSGSAFDISIGLGSHPSPRAPPPPNVGEKNPSAAVRCPRGAKQVSA